VSATLRCFLNLSFSLLFLLSIAVPAKAASANEAGRSVLSVCQVADLAERYASQSVTVRGYIVTSQDRYQYYLADRHCFDKTVAILFPVEFTPDSGIGSLADAVRSTRLLSSGPPPAGPLFCTCTGVITYVESESGWWTVMNLRKVNDLRAAPGQSGEK
jgi:hypothetical protein